MNKATMESKKSSSFFEGRVEYEQEQSSSHRHTRPSLLETVNKKELSRLKLSIRNDRNSARIRSPVQRDIDDPKEICTHLHYLTGTPSKPIFGKDIKVNQDYSGAPDSRIIEEAPKSPKESRSVSYDASGSHRDDSADRSRNRVQREDSTSRKIHGSRSVKSHTVERVFYRASSRERSRPRSPYFAMRDPERECFTRSDKNRMSRSTSPRTKSKDKYRSSSHERKYRHSTPERSTKRPRSRSISPSNSKAGSSHYKSTDSRRRRRSKSVSPKVPDGDRRSSSRHIETSTPLKSRESRVDRSFR